MSDVQAQMVPQPLAGHLPIGSVIEPQYTIRNITFYLLYESELDNLSALGLQETISLTLSVFFASLALSIYVSGAFYVETPAMGRVAEVFVGPILLILSGLCAIWLRSVKSTKNRIWSRIKQESRKI